MRVRDGASRVEARLVGARRGEARKVERADMCSSQALRVVAGCGGAGPGAAAQGSAAQDEVSGHRRMQVTDFPRPARRVEA